MRSLFPGHYRPTEDEFKGLWGTATISLDANVLLGVYRYTMPTRQRILQLLRDKRDRVWLSHQAAAEFQRNRLVVISKQRSLFEETRRGLDSSLDALIRHSFLQPNHTQGLQHLRASLVHMLKEVEEVQVDLVAKDSFRDELDAIFEGRVGSPYEEQVYRTKCEEAERRIKAKTPPGFEDVAKEGDRRYGDAILWFQLLDHCLVKKQPLILVTDERKEDWWLVHQGKTIGPRPELVEEFRAVCGQQFYMYQIGPFLEFAGQYLDRQDLGDAVKEVRERAADRVPLVDDVPWRGRADVPAPLGDFSRTVLLHIVDRSAPGSVLAPAELMAMAANAGWSQKGIDRALAALLSRSYLSYGSQGWRVTPQGRHYARRHSSRFVVVPQPDSTEDPKM